MYEVGDCNQINHLMQKIHSQWWPYFRTRLEPAWLDITSANEVVVWTSMLSERIEKEAHNCSSPFIYDAMYMRMFYNALQCSRPCRRMSHELGVCDKLGVHNTRHHHWFIIEAVQQLLYYRCIPVWFGLYSAALHTPGGRSVWCGIPDFLIQMWSAPASGIQKNVRMWWTSCSWMVLTVCWSAQSTKSFHMR